MKMWGQLFSRGTKFVHVLNLRADEGIPDPFYVANEVLCRLFSGRYITVF